MAVLIRANGTVQVITPAKKKFELDEIQKLLGGYMEIVPSQHLRQGICQFHHSDRDATTVYEIGKRTIMLVNEDGQNLRLPPNQIATDLHLFNQGFPVLGDVVLCLKGQEIS